MGEGRTSNLGALIVGFVGRCCHLTPPFDHRLVLLRLLMPLVAVTRLHANAVVICDGSDEQQSATLEQRPHSFASIRGRTIAEPTSKQVVNDGNAVKTTVKPNRRMSPRSAGPCFLEWVLGLPLPAVR
jgi:hypothetical protein